MHDLAIHLAPILFAHAQNRLESDRTDVDHRIRSDGRPLEFRPNVRFQPRRLTIAPAAVGCKPGLSCAASNCAEPVFEYLDMLDEIRSHSQLQFLELLGKQTPVNEVDWRSAVARRLSPGLEGKTAGADD